jgi:hypothetical protein
LDSLSGLVGGKASKVLPEVPRPRQRVCLESGLKLDLNKLRRQGLIRPGSKCGVVIRWKNTYTGEEIAQGVITSNMEGKYEGWLRIQLESLDQTIILVPKPRHFGGYQWYFVCPVMNRCACVLWRPPGANRFCSRQAWGRRVAYASQFADPDNRAHLGQAKIKSCLIADLDPDEWDLPPKPKWMRWSTYNRLVDRFDSYEEILERGIAQLMAKLLGKSPQ